LVPFRSGRLCRTATSAVSWLSVGEPAPQASVQRGFGFAMTRDRIDPGSRSGRCTARRAPHPRGGIEGRGAPDALDPGTAKNPMLRITPSSCPPSRRWLEVAEL